MRFKDEINFGFRVLYIYIYFGGYIGIMEKKMETTRIYWGIYRGYIGGYIGIMEKKMETTRIYWYM